MIQYFNLAAILWLTWYVVSTACLVNNNIGRKVESLNMIPLVLSIISLVTLGIAVIGEFFS